MKTMTHKNRAIAIVTVFLLALALVASVHPELTTQAYAATTAPAGGGGGGSGSGANDIWDIVDQNGHVDNNNPAISSGTGTSTGTLISKYKTIATAISGVLTITMLIFLLIQISKLGAAGDNEIARRKAIMGILTTGIATALFGGVTIVVGFFWNMLVN